METVSKMTQPIERIFPYKHIFYLKKVGETLDKLETRYVVYDGAKKFKSLVNQSLSKKQPYHRWARYREAYAGDLVKEIITSQNLDPNCGAILDPMCGSGSTNVAAKELSFDSIGLDVNPYSILLTKVKLAQYSAEDCTKIKKYLDRFKITKTNKGSKENPNAKYFPPQNFDVLLDINSQIEDIKENKIKDFFFAAWLSIIEDCSNRRKDGNGLSTRVSPISDPLLHFVSKISIMLKDVEYSPLPKNVNSFALEHSSLDITGALSSCNLKNGIQSIIFSPPYANSFDYFESYKLELLMGNFMTEESIKSEKNKLIRNYRISSKHSVQRNFDIVEEISREINLRIPEKERETGVRDGRTRLVHNMLRCYFDDMYKVLEESFSCLMSNGTVNIVVDQSAYLGIPIPTDLLLAHFAEQIGFEVMELTLCRSANTSGQQLKKFPYLKNVLRETIVQLKKP